MPVSRMGGNMRLRDCHSFHDFRRLARRRLPGPIFDYIDGAADDETTCRRNTARFERRDLVPNVLRGVETIDMSVTVMGQKLALPVYCSPTALQRLFHHQGERAVAAAAAKFGTLFGVSSLGTVSLEELRKAHDTPQVYQFYFHKDRGLTRAMMQRAKEAGVDVMMLTVDSITGGNRERDLRTGFSIPFKLTLAGMLLMLCVIFLRTCRHRADDCAGPRLAAGGTLHLDELQRVVEQRALWTIAVLFFHKPEPVF